MRPQGPKMVKKPQIGQNDTFALWLFLLPLDLSETVPKYGDICFCYEQKVSTFDPGKTPWLKLPFWGLFMMFVWNAVMYVVIVFYGAEFKLTCPNTWNFIVHQFFNLVWVPRWLLGLNLLLRAARNVIMYVVIVGFYGAEFKFTCPNTRKFIVHQFWNLEHVPRDF